MTIIKYRFLGLIRNRMLVFWALVFPILLSTFIRLTVANAYQNDTAFDRIPIVLVNSEEMAQDQTFLSVIEEVSKGEDAILDVTYMEIEDAQKALQDDEIHGFIRKTDKFSIEVKTTGINQTILHTFMNEYVQKEAMVYDLLAHGASYEMIQDVFSDTVSYLGDESNVSGDIGFIYFYSILAMTMLYGGYWSMRLLHDQRADHSDLGQRNSLSPVPKTKLLFIDFMISMFLQLMIQAILLVYMSVVLRVEFGESLLPSLLLTLVGTIVGNAIGVVISMYGPKTYDSAMSIVSSFSLVSCALAGMMMVDLKYIIATNVPWLAAINPGSLITDAFYAQIYYGMGERYYLNLISLLVIALLCYGVACIRLRRKQYASL